MHSGGRAGERGKSDVRVVLDGLRRVVRELRVSARHVERLAGISGAQLFVLQILAEAPALSIGELTERTMTDQSSVSVVVQRLIEKALVRRKTSPEDGRRVSLSVTAAGRKLLARCPEPTQGRLIDALRRLGRPELAALASGISALSVAMGIEQAPARMFFEEPAARAKRARKGRPG